MLSLPQLIEEDVQAIDAALRDLLIKSEATAALVAAEGGFLIFKQGDTGQFDPSTLSALAAAMLSATQEIASVLKESSFASVYQQGSHSSILVAPLNRQHALIVVFPASVSVGAVKYFAAFTIHAISAQLSKARDRAPSDGVDMALLNMADGTEYFHRRPS